VTGDRPILRAATAIDRAKLGDLTVMKRSIVPANVLLFDERRDLSGFENIESSIRLSTDTDPDDRESRIENREGFSKGSLKIKKQGEAD